MSIPTTTTFCPAGQFTEVFYSTFLIGRLVAKTASPTARVQWRRYAAGIPPYLDGTFTGGYFDQLYLAGEPYVRFEFNPSEPLDFIVGPL